MAGADARRRVERRGLALIRVSKARGREDLISPELQDTAVTAYAQRKNIRLVDRVEALDESGSQERSPWWRTLETVIGRVEAGEIDSVIVWKFSRLARHRRRWAIAIDRIEAAGATVESATEDVDTTTSTGRLTRGMLAELAAWEAEVKGEGWREVKERRARLGLADGQPRFGYVIEDKQYRPDPVVGPVVRECYERAVHGESAYSIAFWLNAQGHKTPKGSLWRGETLRVSLRNGFAAGLVKHRGELLPGVHEPLISRELWERFLIVWAPRSGNSTARKHLFTGLLRCGYCDGPLHCYRSGKAFRCFTHERFRTCPQGGVTAWTPSLTREVGAWLTEQVAGQQEAYEQRVREWRKRPKVNVTPLRRALAKTETDLTELARKNLSGFYDDQTYLAVRADLLDTQRLLTKQIEEAQAAEPQLLDYRPVAQVWASDALTDEERRHALTLVLSHVEVYKGADLPKYRPVPLWRD